LGFAGKKFSFKQDLILTSKVTERSNDEHAVAWAEQAEVLEAEPEVVASVEKFCQIANQAQLWAERCKQPKCI
jgi:hypothetical protein